MLQCSGLFVKFVTIERVSYAINFWGCRGGKDESFEEKHTCCRKNKFFKKFELLKVEKLQSWQRKKYLRKKS